MCRKCKRFWHLFTLSKALLRAVICTCHMKVGIFSGINWSASICGNEREKWPHKTQRVCQVYYNNLFRTSIYTYVYSKLKWWAGTSNYKHCICSCMFCVCKLVSGIYNLANGRENWKLLLVANYGKLPNDFAVFNINMYVCMYNMPCMRWLKVFRVWQAFVVWCVSF